MHQCGLPKEMALELFKPFVMKRLVKDGMAHNIKSAKRMVERVRPEVWDVLEDVIKDHPVLLNRAPTLHRLGIQAFEPILVEGRALKLHPLVCTAYNADFDGDQMAVHVPLSAEAQAEARLLMISSYNILNPKDGHPVAVPTQDMVLGSYYLTAVKEGAKGEGKVFCSYDEAYMAYENGDVDLHALIEIVKPAEWDYQMVEKKRVEFEYRENGMPCRLKTTVGRLKFNYNIPIPKEMGYYNCTITKKVLGNIVDRCVRIMGITYASKLLDGIKAMGYSTSTQAGITIGLQDIKVPAAKKTIMEKADQDVNKVEELFRRGLVTEDERYSKVVGLWSKATDDVTAELMGALDPFNPIYMMANSGARGNVQQIRQLAGARGLMADPSGKIIDLPIKANFREGLNILEFFISTHGARKGLADTALRTADSGYLTRRLVDVAQEVIVREDDCGTEEGIWVEEIPNIEPLSERIEGRVAAIDLVNKHTGEVIVPAGEEITEQHLPQITAYMATLPKEEQRVNIRSVLTCKSRYGVCRKCYGRNLATGVMVDIGEAVGTIAAQSIGEPGTQLTMRTFHTGGVAGDDITQGLPRVEELFEARKPKYQGILTEFSGTVQVEDYKNQKKIVIVNEGEELASYLTPFNSRLKVQSGDYVQKGDALTEGSVNPHDVLKVKGVEGVHYYLLKEVQSVYRLQGVDINDKHIEIMIRQMLKKVKIEEAGDGNLLPGTLVDHNEFRRINEELVAEGKEPAVASAVLLGITKAALATDSFLSAASFQETTRVLTDAAINGKVDPLIGLKENVILGKLIPAGTGMLRYRDIEVSSEDDEVEAVIETAEEGEVLAEAEGVEFAAEDAEDLVSAADEGEELKLDNMDAE